MKRLIIVIAFLTSSIIIAGDFGGHSIFEYDDKSFNISRVYLKYSDNLGDDLTFKLTYDVGRDDDGDTKLSSYLKHAYVDWNYKNIGTISLGLMGTNSYGNQENTWGYRFVAKSPLDQEGWTNTADLGLGYSYTYRDFDVSIQFLNGEGYTKEQDTDGNFATYLKLLYGESKLNANDGFNVGLVLNNQTDAFGVDKKLVAMFGGWSKDKIRTGFEYNRYDTDVAQIMISNYLSYSISERWDVFLRNDNIEEVGGLTNTYMYLGAVWKVQDKLHISPNFKVYDDEVDIRLACIFKY